MEVRHGKAGPKRGEGAQKNWGNRMSNSDKNILEHLLI